VITKVSELLDPNTGGWDIAMLSNLLLPMDVGRFLQIPINHQAFDDFLAWNFTKYGRYTV
jgi:hypothetical protein